MLLLFIVAYSHILQSAFRPGELPLMVTSGTLSELLRNTKPSTWSLEAIIALTAIMLTIFLSGLGLILKYRMYLLSFFGNRRRMLVLWAEGVWLSYPTSLGLR